MGLANPTRQFCVRVLGYKYLEPTMDAALVRARYLAEFHKVDIGRITISPVYT